MGLAFHLPHTEPVITEMLLAGSPGFGLVPLIARCGTGRRIHKFRQTIWIENRRSGSPPCFIHRAPASPPIQIHAIHVSSHTLAIGLFICHVADCSISPVVSFRNNLVHSRCALKVEHSHN